ncbi:MAG TPA: protein kinase [Bdellovibrionales bacterium]|nr:protein kinase [Bdellovibrionales bacterium]
MNGQILQYKLVRELGRGAKGVVYLVEKDGVRYALKTLIREDGAAYLDSVVRFREEAQALARFQHEGIVRVHESGDHEGAPFMVMEYVEGQELRQRLDQGALSAGEVVEYSRQIALALKEIHHRKLLHRDIKPENVLVSADGRLKLLDFGMVVGTANLRAAASGEPIVGTPVYNSPEQNGLTGKPLSEASDLYALGVIMYEMLTGRTPFADADHARVLRLKTELAVVNPHAADSRHPFVLGQIIAKLLSVDPAQRYASARSLLADLERLPEFEDKWKNKMPFELGSVGGIALVESPLVGRGAEMDALNEAWSSVTQGHGRLVVIAGEAGLGRTRLAEEMADRVRADGVEILTARCGSGDQVSFSPVRHLLAVYFTQVALLPEAERAGVLDKLRAMPPGILNALAMVSPEIVSNLGLRIERREAKMAQEVLIQHLIETFGFIAREKKGLYLAIEEIQWFDEASIELFRRLARALNEYPILLLLTERIEGGGRSEFHEALKGISNRALTLAPLTPAQAREFISGVLGGATVDVAVSDKIATPANFNPFAIREFLSGIVEAGIAKIEAGSLAVEEARFGEVEVSADISRLIAKRVEALAAEDRLALRHAAVLGMHFGAEDLAALSGKPAGSSLQAAVDARLAETRDGKAYHFSHEKVRTLLLESWDAAELRALNDKAAQRLEPVPDKSTEQISRLADYYMAGNASSHRVAALTALREAGRRAIEGFANRRAYALMKFAADLTRQGRTKDPVEYDCLELYAIAAHNVNRFEEAGITVEEILPEAPNRLRRGTLLYWKMKIRNGHGKPDAAWETFLEAMALLGTRYFDHPVLKVFQLLFHVVINLFQTYTGYGYNRYPANEPKFARKRQHTILIVDILEVGINCSFFRSKVIDTLHVMFLVNSKARYLGPSTWLGKSAASLGAGMSLAGLVKFADRKFREARAVTDQLQDDGLKVFVDFYYVISRPYLNRMAEYDQIFYEFLARAEKLMPIWNVCTILSSHSGFMAWQGRYRELADFYARKLYLVDEGKNIGMMSDFRETYASRLEFLGRKEEAEKMRAEAREFYKQVQGGNMMARAVHFGVRMHNLVEQGPLFAKETQDVFEGFANVKPVGFYFQYVYAWTSQWRYLQAHFSTDPAERARYLKLARKNMKTSLKNQKTWLTQGLLQTFKAADARLSGRLDDVEWFLAKAEEIASRCDARNTFYYVFVERARLARARGNEMRARIEARAAYEYAASFGWAMRLSTLEKEFGALAPVVEPAVVETPLADSEVGLDRERAMNALLEISAAASKSIDPLVQGRATLDTVVRLLGAERACIFLGTNVETLNFFLGRTANGDDIQEMKGFSTTVIKNVFQNAEPMIITGTDQGEALGSKSIVAHNLKSIMVVPLVLAEDIKGVIYLDSSVAKGLFSDADLDLFAAVSTQIASSLRFSELAAVENERQMMKKDLELSASVQKMFLPRITDFDFGPLTLSGFYRPATQCGGDWWWYKTAGERLQIIVGDVTGHGAGPAMITASIASGYKIWDKQENTDVRQLIMATNEQLFDIAGGEYAMSMFGCEINRADRRIKFWSAGAPLAMLIKKDAGDVEFLGQAGALLGEATESFELGSGEYQASAGDRLFIYSDGISEMNLADGQQIGERRLFRLVSEFSEMSAESTKSALVEELDKMRGAEPQDDDFTFVFVDFK